MLFQSYVWQEMSHVMFEVVSSSKSIHQELYELLFYYENLCKCIICYVPICIYVLF